MTIRVKLFGPQARLAGASEVAVEAPPRGATAAEVLAAVGRAEPRLAASLAGSRLAVNHAFAEPGQRVGPDDEVALIGMVGGG